MPPQACHITTPLIPPAWCCLLFSHPDRALVRFFIEGITQGFRIGHCPSLSSLKSARKNMKSALLHEDVIDDYLATEVREQRVVGPLPLHDYGLKEVHINRFGVIPKAHQPDKWRLIVDLSHPKEASVNSGIIKQLCSMSYTTVDNATQKVISLGPGTHLAKIDIKSAFRLIPVHPADRHLLAMKWREAIYIDTCLPFGLRSAPKIFNVLADLLEWILLNQGVSFIMHYLDDYLTIGPPNSPICHQNLQLLIEVCGMLGIPLATHKVEGPSTELEFLGIMIDTVRMEVRLPDIKLERTRATVSEWLHKKNAKKREILSIVGVLQHAAKVVRPGRIFVGRMYSAAAKLRELDHYTRLDQDFRSDLYWWHRFLSRWNGISFLPPKNSPTLTIQTDASGSWGCGGFLAGIIWFQLQWSTEWMPQTIMAKELLPIVISCAVWGPILSRRSVKFQCDNMGVVKAVEKGSSKELVVPHLLRLMWFFVAHYDIDIHIEHIAGAENIAADNLSRNMMLQFFSSNPQADRLPTPLPQELIRIVSVTPPDWTSPLFSQLFNTIISKV